MGAFSFVAIAGFCLICAAVSVWSVHAARRAAASLAQKQRSLESAVRLLTTSQAESAELLEALANKVKMQRVRNVVAHGAGSKSMPDPYRDPDGWRKAMNARINGRVPATE